MQEGRSDAWGVHQDHAFSKEVGRRFNRDVGDPAAVVWVLRLGSELLEEPGRLLAGAYDDCPLLILQHDANA